MARLTIAAALGALVVAVLSASACAAEQSAQPLRPPYAAWKNGPPAEANYFPIAVWLQDPKNAPKYKAAGINLYVGLWNGPTEEQLAALKAAGMRIICEQNEVGIKHKDDPTIIGWMHGDEPDNAQSLGSGKGYGPPIPPDRIVADYKRIREADPTRPVMLNLGQGVAWDGWIGRGPRTNHPEDYPEYAKGGDIISFDIYPVAHPKPEVQGKLWYVARGVGRLVKWAGNKVVWDCIECTRIQSDKKAAPAQVRAEVWMSLIHGSRGLIYFVHEWKPKFNEHALLDDPQMLAAVTKLNEEIRALASVLNRGWDVTRMVNLESPEGPRPQADTPVSWVAARHGDATYVFAVALAGPKGKVVLDLPPTLKGDTAEVIGEGRTLKLGNGGLALEDDFEPYAVHLYRIK